ncbi:MAG: class I SAM-dependent rRNA methyltransferase [Bacteroidetes bacterium]|nr:MAG: class I SAM-dependent rRNA methyltransferase [Bacteroidota bacterium]
MKRTVRIFNTKTQSIQRKHPWIFSGAIKSTAKGIEEGDIVSVENEEGEFLAKGFYNDGSISVRILTFENAAIDNAFFRNRIGNAVDLREQLNLFRTDNNICRLVHGEGDQLPGLIVDYYSGVAVIQCHTYGMYRLLDKIVDALKFVLKDRLIAIYSKSSDTLPSQFEPKDQYLFGEVTVPHIALENGISYAIDWVNGQKTGFFIDQRENRKLLGEFARNKKVLNTFCYSGGFSLAALQNNAALVHSLDSSKKAIALTDQNIALNKFEKGHKSIVADAMQFIKDLPEDYDVVVLDPPAFAKSRTKRHQAVQGYKRLNAATIKQLKPGSILFTFSCSQVVDKQLFTNTIIAAAFEADRNVRILAQLHQPGDHPINASHPEGEYLKGLVLRID